MKVLIGLGYSQFICIDGANAGPVLAALGTASLLTKEGYGCNEAYKPAESALSIEVVDDAKIKPAEEPVKQIQRNAAEAEKRWLEEYREHQETKKALDALKERMTKAGIKFDEVPATPKTNGNGHATVSDDTPF